VPEAAPLPPSTVPLAEPVPPLVDPADGSVPETADPLVLPALPLPLVPVLDPLVVAPLPETDWLRSPEEVPAEACEPEEGAALPELWGAPVGPPPPAEHPVATSSEINAFA
jgi:hypothetical protein